MAKQIRVSIRQDAYDLLAAAAAEQGCTQGDVISAALRALLGHQPTQEPPVWEIIQEQNIRLLAMLQHLMEAHGCWPTTEPPPVGGVEEPAQNGTVTDLDAYRQYYGSQWEVERTENESEPVEEAVQKQTRSRLGRLFLKNYR